MSYSDVLDKMCFLAMKTGNANRHNWSGEKNNTKQIQTLK